VIGDDPEGFSLAGSFELEVTVADELSSDTVSLELDTGCTDLTWNSVRSGGSHSHSVSGTAAAVGSGSAHNNLQPYIVMNYIIKAG